MPRVNSLSKRSYTPVAPIKFFANVSNASMLIIGGGGGGGTDQGGGGGAAQILQLSNISFDPIAYTITVGSGGVTNVNGSNSSVMGGTINSVAIGGGAGGSLTTAGSNGAAGGGGGGQNNLGGSYLGGSSTVSPAYYSGGNAGSYSGGGGGGAGSAGSNGSGQSGGAGGAGIFVANFVESGMGDGGYFGAGGRGGSYNTTTTQLVSNTQRGGGGWGYQGTDTNTQANNLINGRPNHGSGGGGGLGAGSPGNLGGNGGSGLVVIKYSGGARGTGGQIINQSGSTYHIFTGSGIFDLSLSQASQGYAVYPNTSLVNEGDTVFYTVSTIGLADNTVLYWTNSGSLTAQDFASNTATGSFTVTNNRSGFAVNLSQDMVTDGIETLIIQVRSGSISGTVVATAPTVYVSDFSTTPANSYTIDVLIVAGGGGATQNSTGAGGGGGVIYRSITVVSGTSYTIIIGSGGIGANGGNSTAFDLVAIGGGCTGTAGGSGGGSGSLFSPAAGIGLQNNSIYSGFGNDGSGSPSGNATNGGNGGGGGSSDGTGYQSDITGTNAYYGGGGAGGAAANQGGTSTSAPPGGGGSGGASGGSGGNGTANTGGGGGGTGNNNTTTTGGSGTVIIRYFGSQRGSGGTTTSAGGYTRHRFNSSGIFVA